MKKNYNQPIVEATEVQAASMLLDASPTAGISGGGPTSGMGIEPTGD